MNERALKHLFDDLGRSLDRLGEALAVSEDEPLAVDGTIQRFEFTFELFWKAVRRCWPTRASRRTAPKPSCNRRIGRIGSTTSRHGWTCSRTPI
jgi:nucleotidyltransferase-like protein